MKDEDGFYDTKLQLNDGRSLAWFHEPYQDVKPYLDFIFNHVSNFWDEFSNETALVNSIIDELVSDTNKTNYERIINRKDAIKKALDMANKDDIILIAGKGDDNYMAVGNDYLPYKDEDVVISYFQTKFHNEL